MEKKLWIWIEKHQWQGRWANIIKTDKLYAYNLVLQVVISDLVIMFFLF